MGYLATYGFFRFGPKMHFHFCFIFRFCSKNVDIFRGSKHILTPPTYFQGCQNLPTPGSTPLVSHPSCRRPIVGTGKDRMWAVIYEDCRRRVTCTHVLELIRRKDGSIVSISKINEVIVSNCSSSMLWNLQLYNSFEWKNVTFSGGLNILWVSDQSYIFSGGQDPLNPQDLRPCGSTEMWGQTDRRRTDRIGKLISRSARALK